MKIGIQYSVYPGNGSSLTLTLHTTTVDQHNTAPTHKTDVRHTGLDGAVRRIR